jgi:hypothetical protein
MEVLDADSADSEVFGAMLDDDGQVLEKFHEYGYCGGLLICDRVSVPQAFRGRKFGCLLVAAVIQQMGSNRLVVTTPAAFEIEARTPERKRADERNRRLWKKFGFVRHTQEAWWLPNSTATEGLVERYAALVEAAPAITLP